MRPDRTPAATRTSHLDAPMTPTGSPPPHPSLRELLERWEQPMSEEERDALREELRARGHRVGTLDEPPPSAELLRKADRTPPEERRRRAVARARGALFVVAGLQGVVGLYLLVVALGGREVVTGAGEEEVTADVERILLGAGVEVALAAVFLALWAWSRRAALPALAVALALYLALLAASLAGDAEVWMRGIAVKAIVAGVLAAGLAAAWSERAAGEPEAR